ncbi:hypothetical protein V6N11_071398 [Hibiscus sabdariffa]|uniref:Uncharacterized protein n=1 Tax=Hibiscus sabdariffa TaxID=183260 RepID=A0ABR2U003_9ROSI
MYWRQKKKQDGEGSNVKHESMVESLKPNQDWNGEIIPIRVWEVEYPYKLEHSEDLSAGLSVEEDESIHVQWDLGVEAVVSATTLNPSPISNNKTINSKETVVPNSTEMNYDQTRLEQSKHVDLRVCGSQTIGIEVVSDAYTGLIIHSDVKLPKLDVMQLTELHPYDWAVG